MIVRKRFILLVFATAFLTGYLFHGVTITIFNQAMTVRPTPEKESQFFKTPHYLLETVRGFDSKHHPSSVGESSAGGMADHQFSRHSKNVSIKVVVKNEDRHAFMTALRDATSSALEGSGARILAMHADDCGNFVMRYRVGQIEGKVAIDPLETSLQPYFDEVRAHVNIVIEETWDKWAIPEPAKVAVSQ